MLLRTKTIFTVLLLLIAGGFYFFYSSLASASTVQTSVDVVAYFCGNGIVEGMEVCDDGANNGLYGYCKSDCTGLGEHCGDGACNGPETQTTCTPDCTGGGGGGGTPPTTGQVSFQGLAFPSGLVTIVRDGQAVATVNTDLMGGFTVALGNVTPGTYTFIIYADDPTGVRSAPITITITITAGSTSAVSGLFLPPTISTDLSQVKQGNNINFFGYTLPNAETLVQIRNTTGTIIYDFTTIASALGQWSYSFDSTGSPYGDYLAQAQTVYGGESSIMSKTISFVIGDKDIPLIPPTCLAKADLNCDGKVNIIDFSIAAYWWQRPLTPDAIVKVDNKLYPDGVVNLRDFSVMAYYWTG